MRGRTLPNGEEVRTIPDLAALRGLGGHGYRCDAAEGAATLAGAEAAETA
jgi:hypothetical protein